MAVHNTQSYDEEIAVLFQIGKWLDKKLKCGGDVRTWMMRSLLKINNKEGREVPFIPNQGQQQIAAHWGQKNIILKARQLGISTYVAARFFIQVVDPQKFTEGLGKVIDGVVECLNASAWAKKAA